MEGGASGGGMEGVVSLESAFETVSEVAGGSGSTEAALGLGTWTDPGSGSIPGGNRSSSAMNFLLSSSI